MVIYYAIQPNPFPGNQVTARAGGITSGSRGALAVHTSSSQHEVYRSDLCEHLVEVHVQALLNDLSGDDDRSIRSDGTFLVAGPQRTTLIEKIKNPLLDLSASPSRKAGVEQNQVAFVPINSVKQFSVQLLCGPYSVGNNTDTPSVACSVNH